MSLLLLAVLQGFGDAEPHVTVRAADRERYEAGDAGAVLVTFEMSDPWHIYGPTREGREIARIEGVSNESDFEAMLRRGLEAPPGISIR